MTLDIKTAFLLAPTSQDELIVVRPPKILQEAGLTAAVLVDASFAPEDQHGISGLAEALFNALLEGSAAGRSVRSLLTQLQPFADFDLFNDNRAAIILAGDKAVAGEHAAGGLGRTAWRWPSRRKKWT